MKALAAEMLVDFGKVSENFNIFRTSPGDLSHQLISTYFKPIEVTVTERTELYVFIVNVS